MRKSINPRDVDLVAKEMAFSPESRRRLAEVLIDLIDVVSVFIKNPAIRGVLKLLLKFGKAQLTFKDLEKTVTKARTDVSRLGVARWVHDEK